MDVLVIYNPSYSYKTQFIQAVIFSPAKKVLVPFRRIMWWQFVYIWTEIFKHLCLHLYNFVHKFSTKGPYTKYVTLEVEFDQGSRNVTKGGRGGYHKHCHVTQRLKLNKTTVLMRIYIRVANHHFIPRTTIYCGPRWSIYREIWGTRGLSS